MPTGQLLRVHRVAVLIALSVLLALSAVALAAASVVYGARRAGYDPLIASVSVLGETGSGSRAVNAAIGVLGLVMAITGGMVQALFRRKFSPGLWLAASGVLLVAVSLVPINQSSPAVTLLHRLLTAGALATLTLSVFASTAAGGHRRWFAPVSKVVRGGAIIGVCLSPGLLFAGFVGGLWERVFFVLLIGGLELVLLDLVQTALKASANRAPN